MELQGVGVYHGEEPAQGSGAAGMPETAGIAVHECNDARPVSPGGQNTWDPWDTYWRPAKIAPTVPWTIPLGSVRA